MPFKSLTEAQLTGMDDSHVVPLDPGSAAPLLLHPEALRGFQALREEGRALGFELAIASSYRSFASQARIWELKLSGQRAIRDSEGQALDLSKLSDEEKLLGILRWSALPGASRHHWGTDFDVYDALVTKDRAAVRLAPEDSQPGGVYASLHRWLDERMGAHGFFRPYARDLGGVAPEPWHLSYATGAQACLRDLSLECLERRLRESEVPARELVLSRLAWLYRQYVVNVCSA